MPAHGVAPQNLSSDKHVDVCVDSEEDRGSTPLASSFKGKIVSKSLKLTTVLATRATTFADVLSAKKLNCGHRTGNRGDYAICDGLKFVS